jgi:hypothetical protein
MLDGKGRAWLGKERNRLPTRSWEPPRAIAQTCAGRLGQRTDECRAPPSIRETDSDKGLERDSKMDTL